MSWANRKDQRRRALTPQVQSRADWRSFIAEARTCVADAADGRVGADIELRLMTLARRASGASTTVLDRDAGATVADVARSFAKVTARVCNGATSGEMRRALAPILEAQGAFLDDQLHALNASDFERAHAGRPEVYG